MAIAQLVKHTQKCLFKLTYNKDVDLEMYLMTVSQKVWFGALARSI